MGKIKSAPTIYFYIYVITKRINPFPPIKHHQNATLPQPVFPIAAVFIVQLIMLCAAGAGASESEQLPKEAADCVKNSHDPRCLVADTAAVC